MQNDRLLRNKVAVYKLIGFCQEYRDGIQKFHKHMLRLSSLFDEMTNVVDLEDMAKSGEESGNGSGDELSAPQVDSALTLVTVIPEDMKHYWEDAGVATRKFHFYKRYGFHLKNLSKESRIISHKLQHELKHISLKIIVPLKIFDKQCSHFLKHCPCGGKKVSAYEIKQVDKFIDLIPQFWNTWFLSFYSIFYRIHFLLYLQSNQLLIQKLNTTDIEKKEFNMDWLTNKYVQDTKPVFSKLEKLFHFPD